MKFHLAVALLFATGASADPIGTCSLQSQCISASMERDGSQCELGDCVYKICIEDDRSGSCAKGVSSNTWSHICDGADSTISDGHENSGLWEGCPNPTDESPNFWDSDPTEEISGWKMCQHVKGGETAYFVMKDGDGCGAPGVEEEYTIDGVDAICEPSMEGDTMFAQGKNYKTCTGNDEGTECVWQITAPTCDTPAEEPVETTPSISITKTVVNGELASCSEPGSPSVQVTEGTGEKVTICYYVENTGEEDLTGITITDPNGCSVTLGDGSLATGASGYATPCVVTEGAGDDSQDTVATVTGYGDDSEEVTATDSAAITEVPLPIEDAVEKELTQTTSGAFGDPHLKTWTGQVYDFHGQCDLILASSPSFDYNKGFDAHIRTEIRDDWSYISAAAIRIGKDVLEVKSHGEYSLNGVSGADLSQETISGYKIKSRMMKQGDSIRGKFRIGMKNWGTVNIKIYNEFLAVSIRRRSKGFEDSVGLMGSWKEGRFLARDQVTTLNDPNDFGKDWQVNHDDPMLFTEAAFPQYPTECIMPTPAEMENRRRLAEEGGGAGMIPHSMAEQACSHLPAGSEREACVYDVLTTGDLDMAYFDEEFEEDDDFME